MEQAHPLLFRWSSYLAFPSYASKTYAEAFTDLGTFETVERFWQFHEHTPKPTAIFTRVDENDRKLQFRVDGRVVEAICIFREGVRPEWEDEQNKKGGHWECQRSFDLEELDELWTTLACGIVGHTIDSTASHVTGIRCVDKTRLRGPLEYRLEVWTSTMHHDHEDLRLRIEELFPDLKFVFKAHSHSLDTFQQNLAMAEKRQQKRQQETPQNSELGVIDEGKEENDVS